MAPEGRVIKYGLFELVRGGGLVDDPKTSTGKSLAKPVIMLVEQTDRIPLIKDSHLAYQYRIWNLPDQPRIIKLRRVLIHPEMKLPDGSVSTGSDYEIKGKVRIGQVVAYDSYGLNEDYEMVEGDWIFQIWYQDEKLIEQTFTSYWPEEEEITALDSRMNKRNTTFSPGKVAE
jgi:hypothetical protein